MDATLDIQFETNGAGTLVRTRRQDPPWKVVRAFSQPGGQALIHLHNVSGGILGGDVLRLDVGVSPFAKGQITTTSATRIYRPRAGQSPAESRTTIHVDTGGLLEWLPDPLIPYFDSRCRQDMSVHLEDGARFFSWEMLWPGREAAGEVFRYKALRLRTRIHVCGEPIAYETADLDPSNKPLDSPVRMGAYRYLATFYAFGVGQPASAWRAMEENLAGIAQELGADPRESKWGVSLLPAHGITVRGLCRSSARLSSGLVRFWKAARLLITGEEATLPRKIH